MAGECILCGKCLEVCPLIRATNREELGSRAKAELERLLESGEFDLKGADVAKLAGLCLGCHRCKKVCSQGVDAPGIVSKLRAAHPDFKRWLWKTWLTHARELWGTGSDAAKLVPKSLRPARFGRDFKMLAGLKGGPGLTPLLTPQSFPDTYRGEKVLLFAGCTATFVQARWLMAAMKLLDGLGVEVVPGDFQCCGGGLKSAGFGDDAKELARRNIKVWRDAGQPKVITFCASCRAGLAGYDEFSDAKESVLWRESLLPLSSVVQGSAFVISADAGEVVGYHRPCHVDETDSDYAFLKGVLGDRLETVTDKECCGFGGVMRLGAPGLTDQVNQQCWERLGGAETVVTGCSACSGQLMATAPEGVEAGHWLELIG